MNKIYIIGIGPGSYENMTLRAVNALKNCDTIIGYHVYTDLVRPYFPDKEYLTTPMTREIERCIMCFEHARMGKSVAMVCSGDSGVYGMSGPMYELSRTYGDIALEVIPGISASVSGAAILGAPLIHDFATISLSSLLTPWETIEKRLAAAAASDMVICLYNPSSKKRADHLMRACDIILKYASPQTVCGIAENIGREGETYNIMTLKELRDTSVSMFTTIFIGNSKTQIIDGKMVTPRGYKQL